MSKDRIEISFDGEEEEPQRPVTPPQPPPSPDRIVITVDDLANVPDHPIQQQPYGQPYGQQPYGQPYGQPGYPDAYGAGKSMKGVASAITTGLIQFAIAGAIGGFIAWAINEPFVQEGPSRARPESAEMALFQMGLFGAIVGGLIGAALGAVQDILAQVWRRALTAGAIGLGIGAAGGFVGGVVGQIAYSALLGSGPRGMLGIVSVMLARVIGWGLVGLFVGLGQGVGRGSRKRILNGLIGGTVGGLVGGFLFDPIAMTVNSGVASRAIGMTVLGAAAGLAIGLIEEIRKEAWLSVVDGPFRGKQFIIYENITRIGSSPKCEITIVKDPGIMPEHLVIEKRGSSYTLTAAQTQAPTYLDGQPVGQAQLRSGNVITIGSTSLLYEERPAKGPGF